MLAFIAKYNIPQLNVLLNVDPVKQWIGPVSHRTLNKLATVTKTISDDLLIFLLDNGCIVNIKPLLSIDCSYPLIVKHEQHRRNIIDEEIDIVMSHDSDSIKTVYGRLGSSRGLIIRRCMELNRTDIINQLQISQQRLRSNLHDLKCIGKDIIKLIGDYNWFSLCRHYTAVNSAPIINDLLHVLNKKSITRLFQYACQVGSVSVVKLLMPYAHVSARNNIALTYLITSTGRDWGILDNYKVKLCHNNINILELLSCRYSPSLVRLAKHCDYTDRLESFIARDDILLIYLALQQDVYNITYLTYVAFSNASEQCFEILIKDSRCDLHTLVDLISASDHIYNTNYYRLIRILVSTRGISLSLEFKQTLLHQYPHLLYLL